MHQIKPLSGEETNELNLLSKKIRQQVLTMIYKAKSGHPGGSFSAVELLLVLYKKSMKLCKDWCSCSEWTDRDRFVLSKGHASATLYSVLCECGYFCPTEINSFRQIGSRLQGHPGCSGLPGIEVPSGSLGQGLSVANGIALALKLDKKDSRVFVLMGDGELQEGQVWEAAMSSKHYKLDNLIAVVDRNRLQIDGNTESIMGLEPLADKWKAFGWQVLEIDGHNINEVYDAYEKAKIIGKENASPVVIIANTVKGKGVSFMENNAGWHGKPPKEDEFDRAIAELRG